MERNVILRVITRLLIPFILMYGLYIQLHGEYSPGGGFQAGVIFASAFILYALVYNLQALKNVISINAALVMSALGVLIYAGVGVIALLSGGEFLNYSVLSEDPVKGQKLGIIIIELGIGITVFSVMLLIFIIFGERGK